MRFLLVNNFKIPKMEEKENNVCLYMICKCAGRVSLCANGNTVLSCTVTNNETYNNVPFAYE